MYEKYSIKVFIPCILLKMDQLHPQANQSVTAEVFVYKPSEEKNKMQVQIEVKIQSFIFFFLKSMKGFE